MPHILLKTLKSKKTKGEFVTQNVPIDQWEKEQLLKSEFLRLLFVFRRSVRDELDPFAVAQKMMKIDPNSFYANMAAAIAESWHISTPFIDVKRREIYVKVGKAKDLVNDDPRRRRLYSRSVRLIRCKFKQVRVPYEY